MPRKKPARQLNPIVIPDLWAIAIDQTIHCPRPERDELIYWRHVFLVDFQSFRPDTQDYFWEDAGFMFKEKAGCDRQKLHDFLELRENYSRSHWSSIGRPASESQFEVRVNEYLDVDAMRSGDITYDQAIHDVWQSIRNGQCYFQSDS